MVERLLRQLGEDLGAALSAGTGRTPLNPPGGAAWIARWALVSLIVGLTLVAACGYHGGFSRINAWASAYPDWLWQWLTSVGDERVPFAVSLFLARRRPRIFWALVLAALAASAYSRGLKPLFDMPRPPAVIPPGEIHVIGPGHRRASFPSGHSVTAGVFFGVLVYYARPLGLRWLLVLLGVLTGLSRVAVGVHWPADVAFGLLGGLVAAWIGARLAARWPGPASDVSVHLAFVTLACFLTVTLTYWDGGYPLAGPPLAALGWGALAFAVIDYVLRPMSAVLRRPKDR